MFCVQGFPTSTFGMTNDELAAHYRRYLQYLNDRRVRELQDFAHETLVYNGETKTRAEYQDLIAQGIAAAPDLHFEIGLLVVDNGHVACRIEFNCRPQGEFLGLQPSGKRVSFAEHVFYRFRDGKIAEVWSLIDRAAVAAQLST
jgi:predicted ester cyclase